MNNIYKLANHKERTARDTKNNNTSRKCKIKRNVDGFIIFISNNAMR